MQVSSGSKLRERLLFVTIPFGRRDRRVSGAVTRADVDLALAEPLAFMHESI